jgi:O-succinylbenzoic acid--CoA ligase
MAKPLIDWNNDESHVLISPFFPKSTQELLHAAVKNHMHLKGHVWLASSGTENFYKMIALSKEAILASAKAVNQHLSIESGQSWLNILPLFHTGGLAIHARGYLSHSPVFDFSEKKWDPIAYVQRLEELDIAFSSLTPTHVYDIVVQQLKPPKSLSAIIVGGGALSPALHEEAYALGWPLLKSYGMTETSSQIATAIDPNPQTHMLILDHVKLRFNPDDFIEIKSDALLTGFVHGNDPHNNFINPKVNDWYTTQDKGEMLEGYLNLHGRGANFMKIGGENINFSDMEIVWEQIRIQHHILEDNVLIDLPDERLGRIICLAVVDPQRKREFKPLIDNYYQQVLPIAKIREVYYVDFLPRTSLFKLKKEELRKMILEQTHGH